MDDLNVHTWSIQALVNLSKIYFSLYPSYRRSMSGKYVCLSSVQNFQSFTSSQFPTPVLKSKAPLSSSASSSSCSFLLLLLNLLIEEQCKLLHNMFDQKNRGMFFSNLFCILLYSCYFYKMVHLSMKTKDLTPTSICKDMFGKL